MKTEYIGSVTVDTGQIFVGDPGYITAAFEDEYKPDTIHRELTYSACCAASQEGTWGGLVGKKIQTQQLGPIAAEGCSLNTGGDGVMDIFKVSYKDGRSYFRIQRRMVANKKGN